MEYYRHMNAACSVWPMSCDCAGLLSSTGPENWSPPPTVTPSRQLARFCTCSAIQKGRPSPLISIIDQANYYGRSRSPISSTQKAGALLDMAATTSRVTSPCKVDEAYQHVPLLDKLGQIYPDNGAQMCCEYFLFSLKIATVLLKHVPYCYIHPNMKPYITFYEAADIVGLWLPLNSM